jgi:glycosyltransferase involved in cell wall biosynthesis
MTTPMGFTGISTSVMNYYHFMDKSDMQINFVVPNIMDDLLKNQIMSNGGKVYELLMRDTNPFRYLINLIRIIKTGHYGIVHAHGNSCTLFTEMFAAIIGGVRIRIAHSRNTACDHILFHKLLRPFFNISYTHGFACGTDAGKWLFGKKPFTVINNGNDIDKFSFNNLVRQEYRKKYNLDGKTVIGHVGSFYYQKNHDFLINTFYELIKLQPDYLLFLIGDGELRSKIENKVKELEIADKVIFTGKTTDVPNLLQAMDLMVLPSRFEGMPNTVIEWQLACLPSLISDKVTKDVKLTDLVEFMPLEKGPKAWAEKIKEIKITDRQNMSEKAVADVRKAGFDIKENAKELKSLYVSFIRKETYRKQQHMLKVKECRWLRK